MKLFFLAALAIVAALVTWTSLKTVLHPRIFRERVDGGIRLRDTKNGLGVILPGGVFQYFRETVWSALVGLARSIGRFALSVVTPYKPSPVVRFSSVPMFADGGKMLEELRGRLTSIHAELTALQAGADETSRELTDEEVAQIEALTTAFDKTEAEVKRRERIAAVDERMRTPVRRTQPGTPGGAQALEVKEGSRITVGEPTEAMKGSGGFKAFGEMAKAVGIAGTGGRIDSRLLVLGAANTVSGNEGSGADGGYLIPPDFRQNILKKVQGEDSLLSRTDQNLTTSNSINIPVDETTPWQTAGGILAFWEGEGQAYQQSKPALQSVNVRAHKLTTLVPVTDEQLEDGPSLEAYLRNKAPDKMIFKINDALVNGDGQGKPVGILNAKCKITVNKEAGQAANTVVFANIVKMWSRMYDPCRRRAIWLINQDIEQQLFQMVVPGTTAAFPAYMPPGGISQSPYGTLMGRPVVYSEACQGLSAEGDLILWDPTQYLALSKSGGIRSDMSIHLWFDQGLTAFRFTQRLGGLPWWTAPITRKNSANTLSSIVTLQAR